MPREKQSARVDKLSGRTAAYVHAPMLLANDDPLPKDIQIAVFDPATVFRERVKGRTTIYLDTNLWITLSDRKTPDARKAHEACLRGVADGRLLFPLSYAIVSELLEHPQNEERSAQATLMDALSLGVTFRAVELIYKLEAEVTYVRAFQERDAEVDGTLLFTSIPDHIGDSILSIPAGSKPSQVAACLERLRTGPEYRSVHRLAGMLNLKDLQSHHRNSADTFVSLTTESIKRMSGFRKGGKLDRERILLAERLMLFNEHVRPALVATLFDEVGPEKVAETMDQWNNRYGEGSAERLTQWFQGMPALELSAEVMAARSLNPARQVQRQDFWDNEHALLAPVYANAFATLDGGLTDILRERCKTPKRHGCQILMGLTDLMQFVKGSTHTDPLG